MKKSKHLKNGELLIHPKIYMINVFLVDDRRKCITYCSTKKFDDVSYFYLFKQQVREFVFEHSESEFQIFGYYHKKSYDDSWQTNLHRKKHKDLLIHKKLHNQVSHHKLERFLKKLFDGNVEVEWRKRIGDNSVGSTWFKYIPSGEKFLMDL